MTAVTALASDFVPLHRPSASSRPKPPVSGLGRIALLALLFAHAVAANAQSRGPSGGGGRSSGDRHTQDCTETAAGPASRQQLADLAPPDPLGALHSLMIERRPGLRLAAAQEPLYEATLRDLKDLVDINERRFWHVVGTGPVSAAAAPNLERQLANDREEEQDRLAAIQDFLQDWATLRAGLDNEQLALLDTAWRDSHTVAARKRPNDGAARAAGPGGSGSPSPR